MIKTWTRREVIAASVGLSAISPGISVPGLAAAATARPAQSGDGKRVTLLHFTDTHAQLETHPEYLPGAKPEIQMMGGYARLKTAIEHERAHCEGACFLLDGGDDFQGSGPAAWSEGEVILEPLKALGIDVFTPGNWEPAYGPERSNRPWRGSTVRSFATISTTKRLEAVCFPLRSRWSGKA